MVPFWKNGPLGVSKNVGILTHSGWDFGVGILARWDYDLYSFTFVDQQRPCDQIDSYKSEALPVLAHYLCDQHRVHIIWANEQHNIYTIKIVFVDMITSAQYHNWWYPHVWLHQRMLSQFVISSYVIPHMCKGTHIIESFRMDAVFCCVSLCFAVFHCVFQHNTVFSIVLSAIFGRISGVSLCFLLCFYCVFPCGNSLITQWLMLCYVMAVHLGLWLCTIDYDDL